MKIPLSSKHQRGAGFTLVELLLVIAIIAIMASIVISAFSNAASDTRLVLARQQQAVVQEAVNNWITTASAAPGSISSARTTFNGMTTSKLRLELVSGYLDDTTHMNLDGTGSHGTDDQIMSDVMYNTGHYLQITSWPTTPGAYPKVNLIPSS